MHVIVIKVTHEQYGFGNAVGRPEPQYYGPFPEVEKAEQIFTGKLWNRVSGDTNKNCWTAQQGPTRVIHGEIVPIKEGEEVHCVDPYDLPCGGTYYN